MGIRLTTISIEDRFNNLTSRPIIANGIPLNTKEEKLAFNRMLLSEYEGDSLAAIPSCDCQHLTGGVRLGRVCPICHTEVAFVSERMIESNVWIEAPDGIQKLIAPEAWDQLSSLFSYKRGRVNLIEWLVARNSTIPDRDKVKAYYALQSVMKETQMQRGLNFFYENFERIVDLIFVPSICNLKGAEALKKAEYFKMAYRRGVLFSKWLPIPSKVTMVTEQNVYGRFVDEILVDAIDAVRTITNITNNTGPAMTEEQVELRSIKAVKQLTSYHINNFRKRYSSKQGLFRQHIYSSRLDFTGRAVITSLTTQHDYDEIHIPWAMGVSIFDVHLKGKLYRMGYTNRQAQALIQDYATRYHPVLDKLLNELIDEVSFCKGIPVLFLRNPALGRGSSQCLRITKVKTDTTDKTISFSILILSAPNADFDGDEMNLTLIPDRFMYDRCKALAPHHYVMDLTKPLRVSHHIALPKPLISTMAHWLGSNY